MVNYVFWSTMAPISATFMVLVFVWLGLYLARIQRAISEVKAKLAGLDIEELSSRLMLVSVLSNLAFFVVPLIVSLNLIAQSRLNTPVPFWVSMSICLLLLPVLLLGHENKKTRQQVNSALSVSIGRLGKLLLQCRFKGVKMLLYLAVPTYAALLFAILVGWPPIPGPEDWLKGVTIFSLAFGLGCGIADLGIFNANNIVFQVSDKLQKRVEGFDQDLRAVMKEVDELYGKYKTLINSPEYQKVLKRAMPEIQKQAEAAQGEIYFTYAQLHKEFAADGRTKVIQQFMNKCRVVTLADGKKFKVVTLADMKFKEKVNTLSEDTKSFRGEGHSTGS